MNEITLSNDINRIETEIHFYKEKAGEAIWEIGRRLNHVKQHDLTHGEFMNWLERIGIEHTSAKRMMKVANELPKSATLHHLGESALYLIATLPEEEREKEHVLPSGGSKTPDEMTVRELQELKKQLKQKDEQISKLQNRKPEVVEKVVEKEVIPPHLEGLLSDNRQLEESLKNAKKELQGIKERNSFIEKQYKDVLNDREEDLHRKEKLEKYEQEMQRLANRRDKASMEIQTIGNLTELRFEVQKLLEKIAPYFFSADMKIIQEDPALFESLSETVDMVQKWCDGMQKLMGRPQAIEGEVIINE